MMNDPILSEYPAVFSKPLSDLCDVPAPLPSFVSRLERHLLERQAELALSEPVGVGQPLSRGFMQRHWRSAVIALFVALLLALLVLGPQRVLAQVERWLGYVPGIGFVNLAETQALPNPVETTRDGITLRVDQVIAGRQRTQVLISTLGFSEGDLPWPNNALQHPEFTAFLLLPDGSRTEMTNCELRVGAGKLEFPALPFGIHQVTLFVPRLPLVSAGTLPEDWRISLTLQAVEGDLDPALFPPPYRPLDAVDSHDGVTLQILDVAQTSAQTAIYYQVEWTNPSWELRPGLSSERMPELRDDLGQVYWQSPDLSASFMSVLAIPAADSTQPAPSVSSYAGTLVFSPLSLYSKQATLRMDSLEFQVPAQASFSVDLGPNPQIGDSIPLDARLEIAGFLVHLNGAYLREETIQKQDGTQERRPMLQFTLDPPEEQNGMYLSRFDLANPGVNSYGTVWQKPSIGTEMYEGQLEFPSGKIPVGLIELQVTGAGVRVQGPWEPTWDIPGRASSNAARPLHLYPGQPALGTGVRPVVEEVFISDRLTAIKLGAMGLPPSASFVQALAYDPAALHLFEHRSEMYLTDNWGQRYEAGRNQAIFRPPGDAATYDARWLFFEPLQPLTRNLTLHVPGIEILIPAETSFEVEVPRQVKLKLVKSSVTVIGGGGPQRQETLTRWIGDPWTIDVQLDLADFRLELTSAEIEYDEHSDPRYRLLLSGQPPAEKPGEMQLNALRFSRVEPPDGSSLQMDPALVASGLISLPTGGIVPSEGVQGKLQTLIVLDVTAANGRELLPGHYRVELNGLTFWVPGPWDLSVLMSGK